MTRKLFTMSLFAAGLLAVLLFLAQSDSVSAVAPGVVNQAEILAEDAGATAIPLSATHPGDGNALNANCVSLTFTATPAAPGPTANGDLSAITGSACTDTTGGVDTSSASVSWTPDDDFHSDITAVTAPIPTGATTVNVGSTADFPSSGTILIESEFLTYTSKTDTTFTVAAGGRGDFGTADATHATGLDVTEAAEEFTYTATHGNDVSPSASVLIAVTAVNDVPVACSQPTTGADVTAGCTAVADEVVTGLGTPVDITLAGVDADGCDTTIFSFTTTAATSGSVSPTTGVMACSGGDLSATVTYTPTLATFQGTDSFTFDANDTVGTSAAGTVNIIVNAQPVAADQTVETQVNTFVDITLTGSDGDGCNSFAYSANVDLDSAFGTDNVNVIDPDVDCSGTGDLSGPIVRYVPATAGTGFIGTDAFDFTYNDGSGLANAVSDAGTVTLEVGPADGEPGDCNGDGVTDILDVLRLLRFLAGQAVTLSC